MSREPEQWEQSIEKSLARMHEALARSRQAAPAQRGEPLKPRAGVPTAPISAGALATMLFVLAVVTGQEWLVLPALALSIAAGFLLMRRFSEQSAPIEGGQREGKGEKKARIGMGADVASDAVLEPGAVIEMGATVGSGAKIRAGAVVRMGADVKANAVLEAGAVVSWGATVHKGAVVGSNATIGAGADVAAGAHVPAGTYVMPGATVRAGAGNARAVASAALDKPQASKPADPRESRIDSICDRLESELRHSPEIVRSFLGGGAGTIAALRRTCHDLLRHERSLREESSGEALSRLDSERAVLESRIASTSDDAVRRSLQGAVAAIEEQKRQREHLQRKAERLDAELTRFTWTLEGMTAQLVRLRSAAAQPEAAPNAELEESLGQLHREIDAITQAIEHVSSGADDPVPASAPAAIGEVSPRPVDEEPARAGRPRQRDS
jgi:carbonic anhydrase/acetyltransferase-like protein (isoleucine patch superfamily)